MKHGTSASIARKPARTSPGRGPGPTDATIANPTLPRLFRERSVKLDRTYQLNVGGNTDSLNMLERERLISRKISKTRSATSQLAHDARADNVHIGPSDDVPWHRDRQWARLIEEFISRYGRDSAEPSERRAATAQD
jgi:myo-inositol-1-phosphate synthase